MIKKTNKDKKILSELKNKYLKNAKIVKLVCDILPDEFSLHISQCVFNQNTLTIVISNQLIASKLRYSLPQLKKQLQTFDTFRLLRKIRLQINTAISPDKGETKNISKPVYSDKSAELLFSLSDTIDNPELQQSLKKLSQHIKKSYRSEV